MFAAVDVGNFFVTVIHTDRYDVGTWNTDVFRPLIAEIIDIVDHLALDPGGLAVLMADFDHGPDLILGDRGVPSVFVDMKQLHHPVCQQIDQQNQRGHDDHQEMNDAGIKVSEDKTDFDSLVEDMIPSLEKDFAKILDKVESEFSVLNSQDHCPGSEQADRQCCGKRGRGDVDQVVADQDAAEHLILGIKDRKGFFCFFISIIRKIAEPYSIHGGQGCFCR